VVPIFVRAADVACCEALAMGKLQLLLQEQLQVSRGGAEAAENGFPGRASGTGAALVSIHNSK
jgi:hypothetical protein